MFGDLTSRIRHLHRLCCMSKSLRGRARSNTNEPDMAAADTDIETEPVIDTLRQMSGNYASYASS